LDLREGVDWLLGKDGELGLVGTDEGGEGEEILRARRKEGEMMG
jgi:hypothetical protein